MNIVLVPDEERCLVEVRGLGEPEPSADPGRVLDGLRGNRAPTCPRSLDYQGEFLVRRQAHDDSEVRAPSLEPDLVAKLHGLGGSQRKEALEVCVALAVLPDDPLKIEA